MLCDFDGVFYGFGVGGVEGGFFWVVVWYQIVQLFCQCDIVFIRYDLMVGMGEVVQLVFDCLNDLRMMVVGIDYGDFCCKVDIVLVVFVLDFGVFGVVGIDLCCYVYFV